MNRGDFAACRAALGLASGLAWALQLGGGTMNTRQLAQAARAGLIALVIPLATPAVATAAETPMDPVACTNLGPGECDAVEAIFADAFAVASGTLVARTSVPPVPAAPAEPGAPSVAAAPVPAGPWMDHLRVSAVRLASRIALRATLNRQDGSVVHSVEMTAGSLDDIQPAAERMSRALVNRTTVNATMTRRNITRTEGVVPNRTFTERVMGIKTGLTMPFASGVDLAPMLSVQFDGRFETDTYFLEFGAGLALPSSGSQSNRRGYGGVFAEFGGSVYLGGDGTPLYVGAGLVPRLFVSSDDGGVQAAVYGQVGLMFMRTSSTRLYAELRVSQNALPVGIGSNSTAATTPYPRTDTIDRYPTEFGLQMGIGW